MATTFKLYATAGDGSHEINVGDRVLTFRGEWVTVTGWPTTGRNRVWVREADGGEREYFPSVVKAELRRVES